MMAWKGNVARMRKLEKAHNILVSNPHGKTLECWRRLKDYTKQNVISHVNGLLDIVWIHVSLDREGLQGVVNWAMKSRSL